MKDTYELPRARPEAQGISPSAILEFIEGIEEKKLELHGFMLLRHGSVVAEGWWKPYKPELKHMLFSLSKSFTSTAVGFARSEGLLSLDDTIVSYFPDDVPENPGDNLLSMKLRHLLSMATGHAADTTELLMKSEDGNWAKAFLSAPVEYRPGAHFLYNSGATYMLSAVVQKVTGMTLLEYLKSRLFEPLGIEGVTWDTCPRGINTGGWGASMKTEDIARFGLLYLQKGVWNGKRILPEGWVEEATSSHISNGDDPKSDWSQGYGYQFWRCRHGLYRGDGAFGQFCIVMPRQDAVVAINSGINDMQSVMNLVWDKLLAAMQPEALPYDEGAYAALERRLASLNIPPERGIRRTPAADKVSGRVYEFDRNDSGLESVSLAFGEDTCILKIKGSFGESVTACGIGKWAEGNAFMPGERLRTGSFMRTASSAAWTGEDTLEVKLQFIESPFFQKLIFRFKDRDVHMTIAVNVSFEAKGQLEIHGRTL